MNENTKQLRNRYHGALLGLAAGDALGTTLEFQPPGTFVPISDMVGGGSYGKVMPTTNLFDLRGHVADFRGRNRKQDPLVELVAIGSGLIRYQDE